MGEAENVILCAPSALPLNHPLADQVQDDARVCFLVGC